MIELARRWMARHALFLVFNASVAVFLVLFILAPILTHFSSRSEDISENVAQLSHFQNLIRNAKTLARTTSEAGDPFLPGNEERVVSADLQASLKAIGATAGVRFLGIRGLQGRRSQQLHMVTVGVEIEGSLPAVRNLILAIEDQTPLLFVTAASLRSLSDGDEGVIRVELKVQGAVRGERSPSGGLEMIAQ
jgi:general secretion pathway protein M